MGLNSGSCWKVCLPLNPVNAPLFRNCVSTWSQKFLWWTTLEWLFFIIIIIIIIIILIIIINFYSKLFMNRIMSRNMNPCRAFIILWGNPFSRACRFNRRRSDNLFIFLWKIMILIKRIFCWIIRNLEGYWEI